MSISTPAGEQRRPSVVSTGKPAAGAKSSPAGKTGAGPAGGGRDGARPVSGRGGGKGGGPRKPIKPVKVTQERNWGPIALFVAVGVLAVAIVGYGAWYAYQGARPWQDRADAIDGMINFRKQDPELVTGGNHVAGPITYSVLPPVAGPHNGVWQNCMGDVYGEPIASEHAVHSLEHGAVWITYRPDLPAGQVAKLAKKVQGNEFMLMSPYEKLDAPISLQAWGFQLKVDNADDGRIDDFIAALRQNATIEPLAGCSGGITATGTTPRDLGGM